MPPPPTAPIAPPQRRCQRCCDHLTTSTTAGRTSRRSCSRRVTVVDHQWCWCCLPAAPISTGISRFSQFRHIHLHPHSLIYPTSPSFAPHCCILSTKVGASDSPFQVLDLPLRL